MPDAAFESAFSELAHASLREKAPGLMEYLVGFQILDKNDEDTHAVAVFGFKVGNLFAPGNQSPIDDDLAKACLPCRTSLIQRLTNRFLLG